MRYYRLTNNIDIKQIGRFPQSWEVEVMGDLQSDKFLGEGPIESKFKIPEIILDSKAKPTSYLSVVAFSRGFLALENSFVKFLKDFTQKKMQTWNLKIYYKQSILHNYKLFYLPNTSQDTIVNFNESEFYIGKYGNRFFKGEILDIKNYKDYIYENSKTQEGYKILPERITLNFTNCQDHFIRNAVIPYSDGYFVSEKLKEAIEKNGFTGMAFKEVESISPKIKAVF